MSETETEDPPVDGAVGLTEPGETDSATLATSASAGDGPPALPFFDGEVGDGDLIIPVDESEAICWVPAARPPVVAALEAAGLTVTGEAEGATHCVVSTRLPRHRISEHLTVARSIGMPAVILVNPGGEALAIEALRGGADVAIAEGDPIALRALTGDGRAIAARTNVILEAYDARIGKPIGVARPTGAALVSAVSGLPGAAALAARIAAAAGGAPVAPTRILSFSLPALADPARIRMTQDAASLLHRRLAALFKQACTRRGELFDLDDGAFVLLAPGMSGADAEDLGQRLIELVGAYTPDSHLPLLLAVGHAGAESSTDLPTLRELAGRAEATAAQEDRSSVLGAGELAGPLATATELEVTLRLARLAEDRSGGPSRDEIAAVAGDLAARLGFEGEERVLVRFCAHVADIGTALTAAAHGSGDESRGESPQEVAARFVGATAGPLVAAALRHVAERWDGSGGPDGLAGPSIPAAARIVAVADALVRSGYDSGVLDEGAGTRFDPTVVAAAIELARQRN